MKQYQTQPPIQESSNRSKNGIKNLLYILLGLIFAVACAYGAYAWQKNESEQEKSNLQSQIDSLKNSETTAEMLEQVTYESKIGGLRLTLPAPYVVIVNVDGNKGGAPGSTLRIGKESSDGIIQDNVYDWVEIEISNTNSSLDQGAQVLTTKLKEAGFENIVASDEKMKDNPAKLITAKGFSYDANRRIYLVKNGEFEYQFTAKTQDNSKSNEMLKAVLDGVTIEESVLNS